MTETRYFDVDDDTPDHVLICRECSAEIGYYNAEAPIDVTYITLGAYEFVYCPSCGQQYTEGNTLEVSD